MSDSLPLCHGHLTPRTDNPNHISGKRHRCRKCLGDMGCGAETSAARPRDIVTFFFFFFSFGHSGFYDVA